MTCTLPHEYWAASINFDDSPGTARYPCANFAALDLARAHLHQWLWLARRAAEFERAESALHLPGRLRAELAARESNLVHDLFWRAELADRARYEYAAILLERVTSADPPAPLDPPGPEVADRVIAPPPPLIQACACDYDLVERHRVTARRARRKYKPRAKVVR